jgi:D-beta-D-heptose 7-phosphate kinase / D-beta-D-heptose 1-phosphate adenosyltransferase
MLYTIDSITKICQDLHEEGKTIVLATGFFDLLHVEHSNFLRKAKEVGDILVVAVESDVRARQLKGEGRPIEPQAVRCQKVASYADFVVSLGDDFDNPMAYESLMAAIRPDVYAVSSHTNHQSLKQQLTQKYGGELVVVHEFNPEVSTSQLIAHKEV